MTLVFIIHFWYFLEESITMVWILAIDHFFNLMICYFFLLSSDFLFLFSFDVFSRESISVSSIDNGLALGIWPLGSTGQGKIGPGPSRHETSQKKRTKCEKTLLLCIFSRKLYVTKRHLQNQTVPKNPSKIQAWRFAQISSDPSFHTLFLVLWQFTHCCWRGWNLCKTGLHSKKGPKRL